MKVRVRETTGGRDGRMRKITMLLAAMALAALLAAAPAQAATLEVDATTDAADANPGDGECSTAANECTLRAAIQEANALHGDDVIGFASEARGTITLSEGELYVSSNLKINGPGARELSVSADEQSRVFRNDGELEIGGAYHHGGFVSRTRW